MDRSEVLELLIALLQATRADKLDWETTSDEDTFRAMFQNGMVKVWFHNTTCPEAGLYNENNTLLMEIRSHNSEEAKLLQDVYEAARQAALKPARVLHSILDELKQMGRGKR